MTVQIRVAKVRGVGTLGPVPDVVRRQWAANADPAVEKIDAAIAALRSRRESVEPPEQAVLDAQVLELKQQRAAAVAAALPEKPDGQ